MSKSKAKAKTSSKNNPGSRSKSNEYFYQGKKVRPVKVIMESTSYMSAEYVDSAKLITDDGGRPLPWRIAVSTSV